MYQTNMRVVHDACCAVLSALCVCVCVAFHMHVHTVACVCVCVLRRPTRTSQFPALAAPTHRYKRTTLACCYVATVLLALLALLFGEGVHAPEGLVLNKHLCRSTQPCCCFFPSTYCIIVRFVLHITNCI